MPMECEEKGTFAWTWTPAISGLCEIYMNCADIQVSGVTGSDATAHPVSINFQTKFIDAGPDTLPHHYNYQRVDDTTHFTTIYGDINTDNDWSDIDQPVVTEDPAIVDPIVDGNTVCYSNPSMAINLENEIDTNGACGNGADAFRCDDGSCCGQYGYCGTTSEYCDNAVADWRVTVCDGTQSPTVATTPAPTLPPNTQSPTNPPVDTSARFVSYLGQVGSSWGNPATNEEYLRMIGVPGYGGSKGYNYLMFAFWVSDSANGGAAVNGAAFEWQNILNRITSTSLRIELTGSANPTADDLRAAIKSLYNNAGIKIFISAFGGADHPMENGADPAQTATDLAEYANMYLYDGVDVDWEEAISGKFQSGAGGEVWLCALTDNLRNALPSDKEISHAPQSPYFMGSTLNQYPDGGYATVHQNCGDNIDFYNVQFYNQGGSTYNDYASLFVSSIGWSQNSAVYQIMDGASPEGVQVPASKIVVGKHTLGDGSSFIDGVSLKTAFNSALADGRWSAGFMSWQFYKEVIAADGDALIDEVRAANWPMIGTPTPTEEVTPAPTMPITPSPTNPITPSPTNPLPTTAAPSTTLTPAPTNPITPSPTNVVTPSPTMPIDVENIQIVNYHGSNSWYYAGNLNGVAHDFIVQKFEIQKANGIWFECGTCAESGVFTCSVDSELALPFSVRLNAMDSIGAMSGITSEDVISAFEYGIVHDFGSNFVSTPVTPSPTNPITPSPTSDASVDGITLTMRSPSGRWWSAVYVSEDVRSLEMHGSGSSDWTAGAVNSEAAGIYYTFSGDFTLPLSFRVITSDGSVTSTVEDVIDSFEAGTSVTIGTGAFGMTDELPKESTGVKFMDIAGFIALLIVIVAGIAIVGWVVCKRRSNAKNSLANAEITLEQSVVIDVEAQHQTTGSNSFESEADVVTR